MQIDCGRISELLISGASNKGQFIYDSFTYYYSGPVTISLQCSGVHDIALDAGDSLYINQSGALDAVFTLNSSVGVLNDSLNTMALGPDTYLFFLGVIVAVVFVAGVKTRL